MSKHKQQRFLELYDPIHDRFERFCQGRAYGFMDHRDLMQDAVIIAYERFDQLKATSAFLHFLFGIGTRIMANARRKKVPERMEEGQAVEVPEPGAKTDLGAEVRLLYEAMARLPDEQQEALLLFELSGFPIREIAALQGVSSDAVKQRLSRGRKALYQLLKDHSPLKASTQ